MIPAEPYAQVDLDKLLEHLRLRGVTVGAVELQHLQRVFARSPQLSHVGLRELLCSILAKDAEQRTTITRLYNQLIPYDADESSDDVATPMPMKRRRVGGDKKDHAAADADEPESESVKEPLNIWRLGLWALAILTVIMLGVAGWMSLPDGDIEKPEVKAEVPKDPVPLSEAKDDSDEKPGDLKLVKHIDLWYPSIEVEKISPWPRLLPPLLLFLGAGLGFIWLLQQALQRTRLRTPKPPKIIKERGMFHVPVSAKQADFHLLSGDERREMSWGIHHYLTDVPLDKLDINRSVRRSAQIGLPQIEFERATREREVWLWREQSSNHPDLIRHVDEIVQTLRPANIAVQSGYFRGLTDRVRDERGEVIWSSRHEYPEHEPLVVIFADAVRLASSIQQNPDHAAVTLRLLGEWSNLCFVDHAGGLQGLLNAHGLTCLLPNEVSGWLAQQGGMRRVTTQACELDDVYRWAVSCCLPDRVLVEDEVRALHEALDLKCAWQFSALRQYADEFGDGLSFGVVRVEMLNEFSRWFGAGDEKAGKALDFWIVRNCEIDQALKARELEGQHVWDKTRKQQKLLLDRAVLQLWRKEECKEAALVLHDMYGEKRLQRMVGQKLRQFTCVGFPLADAHVEERVCLPWRWDELSAETQQQLLLCGFGGADGQVSRLCLDNATGMVLSVLAGFTLAGFVGSVDALLPQAAVVETRLNSVQPPDNLVLRKETKEQLILGTYKSAALLQVKKKDDHRLVVEWDRRVKLAQQPVADVEDTVVWTLGEEAKPARYKEWPDLSLAVIADSPEDDQVQRLAAHLLDTGNVDRVIVGHHWRKVYQDWGVGSDQLKSAQWLFIGKIPRSFKTTIARQYTFIGSAAKAMRLLRNKSFRSLFAEKSHEGYTVGGEGDFNVQSGIDDVIGENQDIQDDSERKHQVMRLADQGDLEAQFQFGLMYANGRNGVAKSDEKAVEWYTKAAEQGYSQAQNSLGFMYQKGRGVDQSYIEALKWYEKSAEQGYAWAQSNLGNMYKNGWVRNADQKVNDEEAVKWFEKAAKRGNPFGQFKLGFMYETGRGIKQSYVEAFRWYEKSAEQEYAAAQNILGDMYRGGRGGLEQSDKKAVEWFRKAVEQGHAAAQDNLGYMYMQGRGIEPSDAKAVELFLMAAEQGDRWGQNNLGFMYKDGRGGLKQSYRKAVDLFTKAANQGNLYAQRNLGDMYREGRGGLEQFDSQAKAWYQKAADQGDKQAIKILEQLNDKLPSKTIFKTIIDCSACSNSISSLPNRITTSEEGVTTKIIVDCSKCSKPVSPALETTPISANMHSHAEIPGCRAARSHVHSYSDSNHTHSSC